MSLVFSATRLPSGRVEANANLPRLSDHTPTRRTQPHLPQGGVSTSEPWNLAPE